MRRTGGPAGTTPDCERAQLAQSFRPRGKLAEGLNKSGHNMQLAFLGGGNMGRALIGGLLRRGTRPEQISVGESVEAARASLARDLGITATADNVAAVESAELIVLAVKPQDAAAVLASLQPLLTRNQPTVLSVAAGIRASTLETWCGPGRPSIQVKRTLVVLFLDCQIGHIAMLLFTPPMAICCFRSVTRVGFSRSTTRMAPARRASSGDWDRTVTSRSQAATRVSGSMRSIIRLS